MAKIQEHVQLDAKVEVEESAAIISPESHAFSGGDRFIDDALHELVAKDTGTMCLAEEPNTGPSVQEVSVVGNELATARQTIRLLESVGIDLANVNIHCIEAPVWFGRHGEHARNVQGVVSSIIGPGHSKHSYSGTEEDALYFKFLKNNDELMQPMPDSLNELRARVQEAAQRSVGNIVRELEEVLEDKQHLPDAVNLSIGISPLLMSYGISTTLIDLQDESDTYQYPHMREGLLGPDHETVRSDSPAFKHAVAELIREEWERPDGNIQQLLARYKEATLELRQAGVPVCVGLGNDGDDVVTDEVLTAATDSTRSAGWYGRNILTYSPYVIVVGAVDSNGTAGPAHRRDDRVSKINSPGQPDVLAPGENVVLLDAEGHPTGQPLLGTSFASPYVATMLGIGAHLLREDLGDITVPVVLANMNLTAEDRPAIPKQIEGAGVFHPERFLNEVLEVKKRLSR